jgi:hypothetical protein
MLGKKSPEKSVTAVRLVRTAAHLLADYRNGDLLLGVKSAHGQFMHGKWNLPK